MGDFVRVARTDEIEPGQARLIDVKGTQIALFNINGEFYALGNTCTHDSGVFGRGRDLWPRGNLPFAWCEVRHPDERGPWSASV
jgi:Rieske [2Fe-2S] domain